MRLRNLHYFSGIILTAFVFLHLFNHLVSLIGADKHIEVMNAFRPFYRNIVAESVLLTAVFVQIVSGWRLFRNKKKEASTFFQKLHLWSGFYLGVFLLFHISAVLVGRFILHLDTNFYFGVAGLNTFPLNLFFIPYYALAIMSFFGHLSSIHRMKMNYKILGLAPYRQAIIILALGFVITVLIFYGLTNQFQGVSIPASYNVLVGK